MFETDYTFKGIHAAIVTNLTSEIDSETRFKIFERNLDVFILAPIIGYLYGRTSVKDEKNSTDNVKKINFQQLHLESQILNYNYSLIMILHDKERVPIKERLDRAFRYTEKDIAKQECNRIYESYVLGGIEILKEKILDNASTVDDYINNMYNFIEEYNDRYNSVVESDNELLNYIQ